MLEPRQLEVDPEEPDLAPSAPGPETPAPALLHLTPPPPTPASNDSPEDDAEESADSLARLELRIDRLAERFDQLEFVVVEQFEPGMADPDGPGGNLRDRLDRIEAALSQLPAPDDTPELAAEALRLLGHMSEGLGDVQLSAATAAAHAARIEEALEGSGPRLDAGLAEVTERLDALAARPAASPDTSFQQQGFARIATALSTAFSEMEARLAATDERIARIADAVAALAARPAEPPEDKLLPRLDATDAAIERLGAQIAELGARPAEPPEDRLLPRLDATDAAIAQLGAQIAELGARPAPVADLSHQHEGFARFATALSTALARFEAASEATASEVARLGERIAAAEERVSATPEPSAPMESVASSIRQVAGALAAGAERRAEADIARVADRIGELSVLFARTFEALAARSEAPESDALRDLRLSLAELVAENRRLQSAAFASTRNKSDFIGP